MNERCDRCTQPAVAQVTLINGVIYLCAHHWRKHADTLRAQAIDVEINQEELVWA